MYKQFTDVCESKFDTTDEMKQSHRNQPKYLAHDIRTKGLTFQLLKEKERTMHVNITPTDIRLTDM